MSKKYVSPNLSKMKQMIEIDPYNIINQCRKRYKAAALSHNERLHSTVAVIVGCVRQFEASPEDMDKFLRDKYWDGKPHRPKASNIAKLATMFVIGAKQSNGALYQRSTEYTVVVKHFLNSGTDIADIPAELKKKSLDAIIDSMQEDGGQGHAANSVTTRHDPRGEGTDIEVGSEDVADNDNDDNDQDQADGNATALSSATHADQGHAAGAKPRAKRKSQRYPTDMSKHIVIEAAKYLRRFYGMDVEDKIWIAIRRSNDENGFKEYRTVNFGRRRRSR